MMGVTDLTFDSVLLKLLYAYVGIELIFYAIFHFYMIPRANQWVEPHPYRDYGRKRHLLVMRILGRTVALAEKKGLDVREALTNYILGCFDPISKNNHALIKSRPEKDVDNRNKVLLSKQSTSAPSLAPVSGEHLSHTSSDNDNSSVSTVDDASSTSQGAESSLEVCSTSSVSQNWTIEKIGKSDMDRLMSWSIFGRNLEDFAPWEHAELQEVYDQMEERLGLVFAPGYGNHYKARLFALETVDPLHRPLLVYVLVLLTQWLGGLILGFMGYQRVVSKKTGYCGWYHPARDEASRQLLPTLFFHGLAPAGFFFYIPIMLRGLFNDGRSHILFEHPNISCRLGFKALTELETIEGLTEIVDQCFSADSPIAVCGHSFGSVTMTWLLHAPAFRERIRQFVLLEPITLLLSERDVMVNFLYKKEVSKIRMLAGSELFTEYYLRRHFYYYNSELWLDDIPEHVKTLVFLSEKDEIVNAPKVKEYIEYFNDEKNPVHVTYWKGVGHAHCVTAPAKWTEIKNAMMQQELEIVKQTRQ